MGDNFDVAGLQILAGSILALPDKPSHPAFTTYIDLRSGERILSDPRDFEADRAFDYLPQVDLAIVAGPIPTYRAVRPSTGETLAAFDPELSLRAVWIDSEGKFAIATGYDYRQSGLTVRAFSLADGARKWELLLPNNSRAALSPDRSRLTVFREDQVSGVQRLDLIDPQTGESLSAVEPAGHGIEDASKYPILYTRNARYGFLRQLSPRATFLVDIEQDVATNLGDVLPFSIDQSSRHAVAMTANAWRILALSDASTVFELPRLPSTPPPQFVAAGSQALYYDADSSSLRRIDFQTGESETALALPSSIIELRQFAATDDSARFAIISTDDKIHILNTDPFSIRALALPFENAGFLQIDADSRQAVVANSFGAVASVGLADGEPFTLLAQEALEAVSVGNNEGEVIALSRSGKLKRYDTTTLVPLEELPLSIRISDRFLAFAHSAPLVAIQSTTAVSVYNYETGESIWTYALIPNNESVRNAMLSRAGRYFAMQSVTGLYPDLTHRFEVFDIDNDASVLLIAGEEAAHVNTPAFSPDETRLTLIRDLGYPTATFRTYALADGALLAEVAAAALSRFALASDGSRALFLYGTQVRSIDLASGALADIADLGSAVFGGLANIALSDDEQFAALIDLGRRAHLLDLETGAALASAAVAWTQNNVYSDNFDQGIQFLPGSDGFIFGDGYSRFQIWRILQPAQAIPLSFDESDAMLRATFAARAGKAYRVQSSDSLQVWSESDPFDGATAPADMTVDVLLEPDPATFRQVWEYE